MRKLVALLFVAALIAFAYTMYRDQGETAPAETAAEVDPEATPEGAAPSARPPSAPGAPAPAAGATLRSVSIASVLDPRQKDLFSPLDPGQAVDVVIPLQHARERILDLKKRAEGGQQIYDAGLQTVAAMIALGEERTAALYAMVQAAAKGGGTLDSKQTASSSVGFFAESKVRHWNGELARRRPAIEAQIAQLREAERQWNQQAKAPPPVPQYKPPNTGSVLISLETPGAPKPTALGSATQRQTIYPWRRAYYDKHGYPTP